MRIRVTVAMAAVLLCAAISGSAQIAIPGKPLVYGEGNSSCGKWLVDRKPSAESRDPYVWFKMYDWVLGWLSAAGYYGAPRSLRQIDYDGGVAWLDKYCREHPHKIIQEAAASLVDELSKPK